MFKVYEENPHSTTTKFLQLFSYGKNEVTLRVVDEQGKWIKNSDLITFTKNDEIILHENVNKTLGFKLDKNCKIIPGHREYEC